MPSEALHATSDATNHPRSKEFGLPRPPHDRAASCCPQARASLPPSSPDCGWELERVEQPAGLHGVALEIEAENALAGRHEHLSGVTGLGGGFGREMDLLSEPHRGD